MTEMSTGVADSIVVDIEGEGFEDCVSSPISDGGDGEEARISLEDYVSSSISDDGEEAHVSFKREDLNQSLVSSIKGGSLCEPTILKESSASKSCSIHRVPHWRRKYNENAYDPQFISIGPFHCKKREGHLRAMEEHKWRYLGDILSSKPEGWLEDCLATLKGLEQRARNYYSEVITLDSDSFVKMMLLDGCFLVELFRKEWVEDENDALFKLTWPSNSLFFDLLLMENQIPFFILQRVSVLIDASNTSPPLLDSALYYLFGKKDFPIAKKRVNESKIRIRHLLHLLHTSYVLFPRKYTKPNETPRIDCASKLKEGGIKFRKRDVGRSTIDFLDIKFDEDGVIEIPTIKVWGKTEIEFLNLIAFEQCYPHCKRYMTAYAFVMDYLINTAKDVEILCEEGIIVDRLGDRKLIASQFNSLTRDAFIYLDHFYLSDVCGEINKYSQRCWPKLRATLVHDYFKNPLAIVSVFAAFLLLLLTMTQTFFASFPKFAYGN